MNATAQVAHTHATTRAKWTTAQINRCLADFDATLREIRRGWAAGEMSSAEARHWFRHVCEETGGEVERMVRFLGGAS